MEGPIAEFSMESSGQRRLQRLADSSSSTTPLLRLESVEGERPAHYDNNNKQPKHIIINSNDFDDDTVELRNPASNVMAMSPIATGDNSDRANKETVIDDPNTAPPVPHMKSTKTPVRVFSKKPRSVTMDPLPIPSYRAKGGKERSHSHRDWNERTNDSLEMPVISMVERNGHHGNLSVSLPTGALPEENSGEVSPDDVSCPYLYPVDSPSPEPETDHKFSYSERPLHKNERFSETSNVYPPPYIHDGKVPLGRFDSGVEDAGSDASSRWSRSASGSTSSHMPGQSRLSTHYEQAQYEDIDTYRKNAKIGRHGVNRSIRTDGSQHSSRPLPRVNIDGVTRSDSEDSFVNAGVSRLPEERPPVDARTATLPHTYSHLQMNGVAKGDGVKYKSDSKTNRCVYLLIFVLILIFLMSSAALGISIYLILDNSRHESSQQVDLSTSANASGTGASGLPSTGVDSLDEVIGDLRADVNYLINEVAELRSTLKTLQDNFTTDAQSLDSLQGLFDDLSSRQNATVFSMASLEASLVTQINDISLTPGPQGPAGVADFSLCVPKDSSTNAKADAVAPTYTSYLPSDDQLQDNFLMFAFCTKDGATDVKMEMLQSGNTENPLIQYRCVCSGEVAGKSRTDCKIQAILCPRLPHPFISPLI